MRRLSIALRLSLWYSMSAFALIFAATGFLYWVLESNLIREDTRFSRDELQNVRLILDHAEPRQNALIGAPSDAVDIDRELYVRLIDASGKIVVETPGMADVVTAPPKRAFLVGVRGPDGLRQDVVSRDGDAFQVLTATMSSDGSSAAGFVQVAMNRGDEERLLSLYRRRLALVLILSLFATTAIGWLIAHRGLRPIRRIGRAAERIQSTTLNERIDSVGLPAELQGLAANFNSMLDRLEESFGRVSRFSDDVAHELRTPVNNLRGEIEVALAHPRSVESYQQLLGSCLEECARITRIIASLLFLARANGADEPLHTEHLDLTRESAAVLEFYDAAASEKGVALTASGTRSISADLDRTLFQQALGNLVANAIAHTPSGGSIDVVVGGGTDSCTVIVTDTGAGIAPEHLPHVFDRFYCADSARSGAINVGLGLAVVRSIVERHGGSVVIDSELGQGTRLTMQFPVLRRPVS